jgi:citrate lyase subunit gamma (acyl carrier protein)
LCLCGFIRIFLFLQLKEGIIIFLDKRRLYLMASVLKTAQAGTLESSDIMIAVAPGAKGSGIVIELESIVLAQYGEDIRTVIENIVKKQVITDIYIKALDRGALDCTICARTLAALSRAGAALREEML